MAIDQYTKLLLQMDNSNLTDKTGKSVINTGVTLDTSVKKFGNGSAKFDGSSYLTIINSNNDLSLSNLDYTIDFWVYFNSLTTPTITPTLFDFRQLSTSENTICVYINTNKVELYFNGLARIQSDITVEVNKFYHIAIIRNNNITKLYVDGIKRGVDWTDTNNYNSPDKICLGKAGAQNNYGLNGYIDEFRISKGIARWTANFTPPTKPYLIEKYLIQNNLNVFSINSSFCKIGATPTKDLFDKYGTDDLVPLTQTLNKNNILLNNDGVVGIGKQFSCDLSSEMLSLNNVNI